MLFSCILTIRYETFHMIVAVMPNKIKPDQFDEQKHCWHIVIEKIENEM